MNMARTHEFILIDSLLVNPNKFLITVSMLGKLQWCIDKKMQRGGGGRGRLTFEVERLII